MTEAQKKKPEEEAQKPIRIPLTVIRLTDEQKERVREAREARKEKMDLPPVREKIRLGETVIRASPEALAEAKANRKRKEEEAKREG